MSEHRAATFTVTYRVRGDASAARAQAEAIRFEQTVEFPADLIPAGPIHTEVVGQLRALRPQDPGWHEVDIAYHLDTVGADLPQFLNVMFGNTSLQPGVRVERFVLPPEGLAGCPGPRFGRAGLRALLGAPRRPLLCTALKPLGLSAGALAERARQFALGGIDLIKDDHGLADQPYAPFAERVQACAEAVRTANAQTGQRSLYVANITAPHAQVLERAYQAKALGAGAVMLAPGLTGFDVLRQLAAAADFGLPVLSHPAFLGAFTTAPDSGLSHFALYGQLHRLAGADGVIFPNWGGRFAFSRTECLSIAAGARAPMGDLQPIFPAPGGGLTLERIPELLAVYGTEVIFLMGGGLQRQGPDLAANSRYFRALVEAT